MITILGFILILMAGMSDGSFYLPMKYTRKWEWEHTWATFSLLGMLVFNWLLALLIIPNIMSIYSAVPSNEDIERIAAIWNKRNLIGSIRIEEFRFIKEVSEQSL